MVRVSCNISVDCDSDIVWNYIENVRNLPKWAQGVVNVDFSKKKDGRKFKQTIKEANKRITYQGEILECQKNKIFKTIIRNEGVEIINIYEFISTSKNETELIYTVDIPSKTWLQWFFAPISLLFSKYTITSQGQSLKEGILKYKESLKDNKK